MASSSPHRLLLLALLLLHATRATRLPHIVFFLADDYGFGDVGYHAAMYGNDTNRVRVQTPYAAALIPSYAAVNGSQTVRRASLSSLRYHGVTTALPRQTLHSRVGTATHLTLLSPSLSFLPAHCTLPAPQIATPTLDSLSAAGVRLENYYIQPVCSPTRATLMTGRYVHHHGIHTALIDSSSSALPLNETTLAERLRSAGYATHAVGKW